MGTGLNSGYSVSNPVPANEPGEATEEGSSAWASDTKWESWMEFLVSGISLGQSWKSLTIWEVKQWMVDYTNK